MKHWPPVQPDQRRAGRLKPVALTAAAVAAFGLTVGAALAASGFVDVTDNHRASAEITAAHQVGVFQGYGDGTFRPDGKLTRGQAELVIHRMLTWQGTDDDGNFEISRADAAVLAMSGLCGLDPDRIPSCAAVGAAASEAEVQAAYDRGYGQGYDEGYDEGIDDASTGSTPTGSTPPPVTAPPEPRFTTAEKCDWIIKNRYNVISGLSLLRGHNDGWAESRRDLSTIKRYYWLQRYTADLEAGPVCAIYNLSVSDFKPFYPRSFPHWNQDVAHFRIKVICWITMINPVSGLEYEQYSHRYYDNYLWGDEAIPVIRGVRADDRPDPYPDFDHWPAYDPADCLSEPLQPHPEEPPVGGVWTERTWSSWTEPPVSP